MYAYCRLCRQTDRLTEDLDRAAAASVLAKNPALVAAMQQKLGSLVGRSSGYVESLPAPVRRRITGLHGIQKDHSKLEAQFQEEVLELEKKYFKKFTPLYERRAKIVNGQEEPTDAEVEAGKKEGEEESTKEAEDDSAEDMKGIPEFWLTAMKNQVSLAEMITERDEEALRCLTDIRMEYLDKPGFKLIFEFAPNDFFSNSSLSKTYYYREESGFGGDFIYDHADGDKIDWKAGKDLTVRIESKKQRNKNTKQTRVVRKQIPAESFFNWFQPPQVPDADDDASISSEAEARLELDYQIAEDMKEQLVSNAVGWFDGSALPSLDEDDDLDEDSEELSPDDVSSQILKLLPYTRHATNNVLRKMMRTKMKPSLIRMRREASLAHKARNRSAVSSERRS